MATAAKTAKAEREAAQVAACEYMREAMGKSDGVLYGTTDYVGNTGTAYVRVFIVMANHIYNVTGYVARAIGETPRERDGKHVIRTTGYGYHRLQHVADALSWNLYGEGGGLSYRDL